MIYRYVQPNTGHTIAAAAAAQGTGYSTAVHIASNETKKNKRRFAGELKRHSSAVPRPTNFKYFFHKKSWVQAEMPST